MNTRERSRVKLIEYVKKTGSLENLYYVLTGYLFSEHVCNVKEN